MRTRIAVALATLASYMLRGIIFLLFGWYVLLEMLDDKMCREAT